MGIEVGITRGSVKNSGKACVFCIVVIKGGLCPLYKYGTKYTSLPRVFDTPSSHSNFHPNSNSNLNSKLKNKKCKLISILKTKIILEFELELKLGLELKLE